MYMYMYACGQVNICMLNTRVVLPIPAKQNTSGHSLMDDKEQKDTET